MSGADEVTFAARVDAVVSGLFWPGRAALGVRGLTAAVCGCGGAAGLAVGLGGGAEQALYAAAKVPLLLLVSAAVVLPGFMAILVAVDRTVGARETARLALTGQAATACVLLAVSPVVVFLHANEVGYAQMQRCLAVVFLLASASGQIAVYRLGGSVVRSRRVLRIAACYWGLVYPFVGIQAAWVLRPFIGAPGIETTFFRDEAWTNAYVAVVKVLLAGA